MNKKQALQKLGRLVTSDVRDATIEMAFRILDGKKRGPNSRTISPIYAELTDRQKEKIRQLVIAAVDGTVYQFLWMLEQNAEDVLLGIKDGRDIIDANQISDGLAGEVTTAAGWLAQFGKFPLSADLSGEP